MCLVCGFNTYQYNDIPCSICNTCICVSCTTFCDLCDKDICTICVNFYHTYLRLTYGICQLCDYKICYTTYCDKIVKSDFKSKRVILLAVTQWCKVSKVVFIL